MELDIRPLSGHCGADIHGLDLNRLDGEGASALAAALYRYGVVACRDQDLTPDAHIALAERFGEIVVNRFFTPVDTHPRIAEVRTKPDQTRVIGGTWHSDHSYDAAPAKISILAARELPPYGGDTLFASQVAAAAALSPGLRATLEGLDAWHTDETFAGSKVVKGFGEEAFKGATAHPVLIRHPETGAQALFVNTDFTTHFVGWTEAESAPLLQYLYGFCTQPIFACRVRWQPGTVVLWDNRLVQHYATADYAGHARLMHRITIAGEPLGR